LAIVPRIDLVCHPDTAYVLFGEPPLLPSTHVHYFVTTSRRMPPGSIFASWPIVDEAGAVVGVPGPVPVDVGGVTVEAM